MAENEEPDSMIMQSHVGGQRQGAAGRFEFVLVTLAEHQSSA
jgi:hypothetical protein